MSEQGATDPKPQQPGKPPKYWIWPAIIVGLLAVHTLAMLIVIMIATNNPSEAVVSDYHAKAVAWDEHQAQVRASEALGWTVAVEASPQPDLLNQRTVRISLKDADANPLTDAKVHLKAYHHARAADIKEADVEERAPGEYIVMIDMRRNGMWAFEIEAHKDEDTFITRIDQQVGPTKYGTP